MILFHKQYSNWLVKSEVRIGFHPIYISIPILNNHDR